MYGAVWSEDGATTGEERRRRPERARARTLHALAGRLLGRLIDPAESEVRGAADAAVVVRVADALDIAETVRWAREAGVPLGGPGGVVIDVADLRAQALACALGSRKKSSGPVYAAPGLGIYEVSVEYGQSHREN